MQNLLLHHICYTKLNNTTWCATATVGCQHDTHNTFQTALSAPEYAVHKRQQQRYGVRLLLQYLLARLSITDTLDESQYPYQLTNHRYYVCFSHTNDGALDSKVAVIISYHRPVGIDIETSNIAWTVAQRFYHYSELMILRTLPLSQRDPVTKTLWQIKESFIKINQYTLAQGLGMPYLTIMQNIVQQSAQHNSALIVFNTEQTNYQVAILSNYQTIVIF